MMASPSRSVTARQLLLLLTLLALLLAACEQGAREETTVFQEAEALYRAGDYDNATERYEAFLETYPRSPFAHTARLRLRTIDREIESVMGTRGTNRPIFLRPTPEETESILSNVRAASAPPEPPEPTPPEDVAPPAPDAPTPPAQP